MRAHTTCQPVEFRFGLLCHSSVPRAHTIPLSPTRLPPSVSTSFLSLPTPTCILRTRVAESVPVPLTVSFSYVCASVRARASVVCECMCGRMCVCVCVCARARGVFLKPKASSRYPQNVPPPKSLPPRLFSGIANPAPRFTRETHPPPPSLPALPHSFPFPPPSFSPAHTPVKARFGRGTAALQLPSQHILCGHRGHAPALDPDTRSVTSEKC